MANSSPRPPTEDEIELLPESANAFSARSADIELVFKRDSAGKVDSIKVHQGGQNLTANRIE
jgi:hypothetical protein